MVSAKGPGPLLCPKQLPEMESSKAREVSRGENVQCLLTDSWADSGRERVTEFTPLWQFELLLWGISSAFPLANHFDLPYSQSIFDRRILPHVCMNLLAKMDFTEESG